MAFRLSGFFNHVGMVMSNQTGTTNSPGVARRPAKRTPKKAQVGIAGRDLPEQITIIRHGVDWEATADGESVAADNPAQAVGRLLVRLRVRPQPNTEATATVRATRAMIFPTCSVLDFHIEPGLDNDYRYLVEFTSNVGLIRGDIEALFCAMMRLGAAADD